MASFLYVIIFNKKSNLFLVKIICVLKRHFLKNKGIEGVNKDNSENQNNEEINDIQENQKSLNNEEIEEKDL